MRQLLPLLLLCASACSQTTSAQGTAVPQPPGPGPMQAEADEAKAAIEATANACAQGRIPEVKARFPIYSKVSRPLAPDLGELELPAYLDRLCAGEGAGSLAEVNVMVEEIAIQTRSALATVTLHGRLRGTARDEHFVVRGLVQLERAANGWLLSRAAYWPHEIPPVS